MTRDRSLDTAEQELKKLEFRIGELIHTCERLKEENRLLREQYQSAVEERGRLEIRSQKARSRVEAIVERLRSMESSA